MIPWDPRLLATPIEPDIAVPGGLRPASVLVAVCGAEPEVIMTVKARGMRLHAGEVSFPGGKPEPGDADLLETALREAREEVGLDVPRGRVVGQLAPVRTLNSGFVILPFVALPGGVPRLRPNPEVGEILRIPLVPLLETMAPDPDPAHHAAGPAHVFEYGGRTVWGASARMLAQVRGRLEGG